MDIALIPQSAPFSPEQRAWLNGFLAGWIGLQSPGAAESPTSESQAQATAAKVATAPAAEPEPQPWHDPAIAIDERLKLAEGKPLSSRLMAAMAQLDCGTCGYVCHSYADAIASGKESRVTLCSPGGSETSRALKRLMKERPVESTPAAAKNDPPKPATNGWSRENPYAARFARAVALNQPGSEKDTRHIEIELGDNGPKYSVGDSLGVYPENCPALVDEIVAAIGAKPDDPVTSIDGTATTLRDALIRQHCLNEIGERLLELLGNSAAEAGEADQLRMLIDDDAPIAGFDVLDLLRRFPSTRSNPQSFVAALAAMKPRLYSISSSPARHAGWVHLTVRRVEYDVNGRTRKGVASTMLADRVSPGGALRVFVQKSHGFGLPADPATPIIMIGPGAGIAPFRAFLHEREAQGATGRNWLFFGDQRICHDFLYEDEMTDFLRRGILTRLDTAFSRDQERKIYVQHRIRERGDELFRWLEQGASVYVCGDAKRMAADVDRALRSVAQEHGAMSEDAAAAYVKTLAAEGRYLRDVY